MMSKSQSKISDALRVISSLAATAASGKTQGSKKQGKNGRKKKTSSGVRNASSTVQVPVQKTKQARTATPSMKALGGDGRIRVTHRELLCDLAGAVNFSVTRTLALNPGVPESFPWLSGIAHNYESYLFRSLRYDYVPTCGNSSPGKIYMCVDFDALDDPPISKQALMQFQGAASTAIWSNIEMDCASENLSKFGIQRYTRIYNPPATGDLKTYDVGKLIFASADCLSGANVGELYVTYTVDLITPQANMEQPSAFSGVVVGNTSVSRTQPLGTAPTFTDGDANIISAYNNNGITFSAPGEYLLDSAIAGTAITSTNPAITTVGGVVVKALESIATTTLGKFLNSVKVSSVPASIAFDFTPSAGVVSSFNTRVAPYKYAFP